MIQQQMQLDMSKITKKKHELFGLVLHSTDTFRTKSTVNEILTSGSIVRIMGIVLF
ncbi:hypothetical protein [Aneurinibacillus migulanus]|uniref:hypothetical protein n=2 Tax=Aneurinibacillus migulanus TaxID=47500 RepID=UPI00137929FC|nr:hypothetical protein [Aneurinibacillus migulanus]MCP1358896.1 hypothetical protein [Aneurinibacillus migulanus]MED4729714.1 hypothetical protein [Aneurinibacillus migulanus]